MPKKPKKKYSGEYGFGGGTSGGEEVEGFGGFDGGDDGEAEAVVGFGGVDGGEVPEKQHPEVDVKLHGDSAPPPARCAAAGC